MLTDPQRIQDVFLAAAEIPDPAERARFLDRACGGDTGLRCRVEDLLRAHDQPDSLLDHPAVSPDHPNPADSRTLGHESGAGAEEVDATQTQLALVVPPNRAAESSSPSAEPLPARIGRFEIRRSLGEGGFGRVYEAYDTSLKRVVALKVAKPEQLASARRVRRFEREAQAAAALAHPNIVGVFDAGRDGPHHYIATAFVKGRSLAALLAEQPGGRALPVERAVRLVRRLAEALAYAHGRGVIHRDVKPANVLLDEKGEPLLADFGLAARAEEEERLTADGQVMGTPAYLAPEQWQGQSCAASDQYSLGCLLYELSTGQPPFTGSSAEHYLFLHCRERPRSPRQLNRAVPRDLETVCLRCLEKEAGRRYPDCQALADDLRRWQDGEPIQARRAGPLERLGRWARRNPAVAGLTAVVALTLLSGTGVASFFAVRANAKATEAEREKKEAENARKRATAEGQRAEKLLAEVRKQLAQAKFATYLVLLRQAENAMQRGLFDEAQAILGKCESNLRGWEHAYLFRQTIHLRLTLKGHTGDVLSVCFSPDGRRIASTSTDNTVKIWDAQTGQEVRTLQGHTSWVTSVVFSPDGKRIASASEDGTVKVWDAQTGQEVRPLKGHTNLVSSVVFSPDGKRLASGSYDQTVKVWDAATGQQILSLTGHTNWVRSVAFSPAGKRIASASSDGTVKVWDAQTGQELLSLKGGTNSVYSVAFSPGGKRLASGSADQTVGVWDAATGQQILSLTGHTGRVWSVCFSPDGERLASGSHDHTVKVWEAQTGQLVLTLKGHTASVFSVAFSPDGKRLASASRDGTVKVWDAQTGQEVRPLKGLGVSATSVAFSPDGKRLASVSWGQTVEVWDAQTGQEALTLKGHTNSVFSVAFSPDGKRIASASEDGTVKVWDAQTGQELLSLKGGTNSVYSVAFSPDGKRIASGSSDKTVRVWDTLNGEALTLKGHTNSVFSVAFSPDGKRIASASSDGTVKVWEAQTGQEVRTLKGVGGPVAFSPDGKRIASGGRDRTVKVWDAQTGQEALTLKGHTGSVYMCFSPDGKRLASGSQDGTVKVWEAAAP